MKKPAVLVVWVVLAFLPLVVAGDEVGVEVCKSVFERNREREREREGACVCVCVFVCVCVCMFM